MPPVQVMGHLLPSRAPDKRSDHLESNRGANSGIGSTLDSMEISGEGRWRCAGYDPSGYAVTSCLRAPRSNSSLQRAIMSTGLTRCASKPASFERRRSSS